MLKKLGLYLVFVVFFINLVGCSGGSYRISVGSIKSTGNELSGTYHSFSGHYFKQVKIGDGESLHIHFSVNTEKGNLVAKVIDEDGNTVKTLLDGDITMIDKPGNYKLQVEGKNHKGGFILSWKNKYYTKIHATSKWGKIN
jgi:hypothetical protein